MTSSGERPSFSMGVHFHTTNTIRVIVGKGSDASTFQVNKAELCQHSEYFRRILRTRTVHDHVGLYTEDPRTFELFHTWLQMQDPPPVYSPNDFSDEPWRSLAAQAHVLGQHLESQTFTHYAFAQFVVNCALVEPITWHFIETHTTSGQPLRRFSDHWIAWNVSLGQTEYLSFMAASLAHRITRTTRDPRTYLIDHWYQHCAAGLGQACVHNVKAQETVTQSVNPVDAEIGKDWELTQRGRAALPTAQAPTFPSRSASSYMPTRYPSSVPPRVSHRPLYRPSSVPARSISSSASPCRSNNKGLGVTNFFMLVFCVCNIVSLGLSAALLANYTGPNSNINPSLPQFQIAITVAALIALPILSLSRGSFEGQLQGRWSASGIAKGLYCLFSFSAAVKTTEDAADCIPGLWFSSSEPCDILAALSFFTWMSFCLCVASLLLGCCVSRSLSGPFRGTSTRSVV